MKTRKRFNSEAAIIAAIDAAKTKAEDVGKRAEARDEMRKLHVAEILRLETAPTKKEARGDIQSAVNKLKVAADFEKKQASKLWKQSERLLEVKVKKLGIRLSEFRTPMVLTGTGLDDQSVPQ